MKRLLALLLIVLVVTACSDNSTSRPESSTISVTPTPSKKVTRQQTVGGVAASKIASDNQSKLSWARSYSRKALYRDYLRAKYVVARALASGKLGTPYRVLSNDAAWHPGQVGWGQIGINNADSPVMNKPSAFANVWLRADGSIDFSRGVTGIRIDAGPATRGVIMYDTMHTAFDVKPAPSYEAAVDQFGASRGIVWSPCIDNFGFCERPQPGMKLTKTGPDLEALDKNAISALDASMRVLFGPRWRTM